MIKIVALICAITQPHATCQPDTARSVMTLGEAPNELACLLTSQQTLAKAYELFDRATEYAKISCERRG